MNRTKINVTIAIVSGTGIDGVRVVEFSLGVPQDADPLYVKQACADLLAALPDETFGAEVSDGRD